MARRERTKRGRWPTVSERAALVSAAAAMAGLLLLRAYVAEGPAMSEVSPSAETDPVPGAGDAADDPCVWIHPDDPSKSLIIGADKTGGIGVYDLDGKELQFLRSGRPNNVDIRYGFPSGDGEIALIAASDREENRVACFTVDAVRRRLVRLGFADFEPGMPIYGLCLYRRTDGTYHVFLTSYAGRVEQWELFAEGGAGIGGRLVRAFDVGTEVEGAVADDELGHLYLAEEDVALWKYDAAPDGGEERTVVDRVGNGLLGPDIEGLALYNAGDGKGYLLASNQGASTFAVYRREGRNEPAGAFRLVSSGAIDGVSDTDGIDVVSCALGERFPRGLFIAQDGRNDGGNQNFKLVAWERIAEAMSPPLVIEPSCEE